MSDYPNCMNKRWHCEDCPYEDDPYDCTIPRLLEHHPEIVQLLLKKQQTEQVPDCDHE